MLTARHALVRYRDLLFMITWRDIHIKYKQSVMGFLWAIFMPMIIVAAGTMIKLAFSYISHEPLEREGIVTIAVKSVPWAFFVGSIRFSSASLIANANLVTKIYFPRIIFPVSAVISQLFDFAIASIVLVVILVFLGVTATVQLLWVPLLIAILTVMVGALGIFLSAANLFFRDVKYLVEVILTFAIFFTPVFYEPEMFGKRANLILLNPVAPILEGLRACVVQHHAPSSLWTIYSASVALLLLALSLGCFARWEPQFAESI